MGLIVSIIVIILAIIGTALMKRDGEKIEKHNDSSTLTDEVNAERKAEGKYTIRPINALGDSTNRNYSDHEEGWSNVFGFFHKMLNKDNKKGD